MIITHKTYKKNEIRYLLESHNLVKKGFWPAPKKEITPEDFQTIINKEKSRFPGKQGGILFEKDSEFSNNLSFILQAAQRAGIEHYTRKHSHQKEISEVELITNNITTEQKNAFSFYYIHFEKREKLDVGVMISGIAIFCLIACGMKLLDEDNPQTTSQPKEPTKLIQKARPDKIKTTEHIHE